MEGVGARFGRSSTRYGGPTSVFTGPVRKWKKKWVHVPPSNSNHHNHTAANGTVNGSNGSSHLLLYKWTPMAPSQTKEGSQNDNNSSNNGNAESKNSDGDDDVAAEEPPRRKFKYIPIIVLEEQKNESEQTDDETKPLESSINTGEATPKSDGYDEKPDINDVPMDENQATDNSPVQRQDLNERTLDLSLGLKAHDGENKSTDEHLE
ncbi:hypothetical protein CDL12_05995 [Handroanthus impetiginosus]|uniref:Uncharacterized protein n=1 Tax=Handroanthus impetiginosus TaxID=429701 RepID=A0A2G9HUV6_9LAMI|nr:hypothetical protein CDL12_05995 [Handroanthus impetiginosus]